MRRMFAAALAAFFMSAVPAFADDEDQGCISHDAMLQLIQPKVETIHAAVVEMDHDKSQAFLKILNAVGEPTDYQADKVFFVVAPDQNSVWVFLDKDGCVDHKQVHIAATVFLKIYRAVNGDPV